MKSKIFSLLFFIFAIVGCKETPAQQIPSSITEDDQIRAAIYESQIADHGSRWPAIFLGLNDSNGISGNSSDPSEALLNVVKTSHPNVRKYSQAHFVAKCIYETDSTQCGVILMVCPLQRISPSQVQAIGAHHINARAAAGSLFFLHKEAQSWIVDSSKIAWLS